MERTVMIWSGGAFFIKSYLVIFRKLVSLNPDKSFGL